ncbi:hypothetical protein LCGC14_1230660, partial [marine sediment metagenome]
LSLYNKAGSSASSKPAINSSSKFSSGSSISLISDSLILKTSILLSIVLGCVLFLDVKSVTILTISTFLALGGNFILFSLQNSFNCLTVHLL